jgi:hypothetical protein
VGWCDGCLVNGPIGFWFGYFVECWVVRIVGWSVGGSMDRLVFVSVVRLLGGTLGHFFGIMVGR